MKRLRVRETWQRSVPAQGRAWLDELFVILPAALVLEGFTRLMEPSAQHALHTRGNLALVAFQVLLQSAAALWWGAGKALHARAPRRAFAFFLVVSCAASYPVLQQLTAGEWIAQQPYAAALRWGGMSMASLAGAFLCTLASRIARLGKRSTRACVALGLVGVGLAASLVNMRALPGLYGAAHIALMALGSVCLQWTLVDLCSAALKERRLTSVVGAGVSVLAFIASLFAARPTPGASAELMFRSVRAGYWVPTLGRVRERTSLLGYALEKVDCRSPLFEPEPARSDWTLPPDWNVLLIVVDTLRADTLIPALGTHPVRRFERNDAPFLNAWLENAFRFDAAYAAGNVTNLSMPSLFGSCHTFECRRRKYDSLALRMEALGRRPVAVVPDLFHKVGDLYRLLDGFAEVSTYREADQAQMLPAIERLFEANKGEPFFAWLHYVSVHQPGWDGAPPPKPSGAWAERYVKSLRWTDSQLEQVFARLERLGLADKTLVVFTADHGEGLGDNGLITHAGAGIDEEIVRVPLSVLVPGRKGRHIHSTVGNVDIVPTIVDLLGATPSPQDRGRSLVPLLQGKRQRDRAYYMQSMEAARVGVVRGTDKFVVDRRTGSEAYFELDPAPWTPEPVLSPHHPGRLATSLELIQINPSLASDELRRKDTAALLTRRLDAVVPDRPVPKCTPFLLELVGLQPTAPRLDSATRLFVSTSDVRVQKLVLEKLLADHAPHFLPHVEAALVAASPERQAVLIGALADLGVPAFAEAMIAEKFVALSDQPVASWMPWLRLVGRWKLDAAAFAAPLESMLRKASASPTTDPRTLLALLRALAGLSSGEPLHELVRLVEPLTQHADGALAIAAHQALAAASGSAGLELLRARLEPNFGFAQRRAALDSLVRLQGKAVLPDLVRAGHRPGLLLFAVDAMRNLGDPAAVPFLDEFIPKLHGWQAELLKTVRAELKAPEKRRDEAGKPPK